MKPNFELKGAAVRQFGSCIRAARVLHISESKLSRIIQGHTKPSEEDLLSLRRVFGSEIAETFAREDQG
jgi:plasmid maintenance system antidote protein VapI